MTVGSPWRGWPPQVKGALLQREIKANTLSRLGKQIRSHQTAVSFAEKMFRWKSLHQTAPAGAQRQAPAPLQLRIFGKHKFPKHFQRSHSISTRSDFRKRELYPINRVIQEPNPPNSVSQSRLGLYEIHLWVPARQRPLFLLGLQIFFLLHCVARLESKNSVGWIYLYYCNRIAYNCIASQLSKGRNIPM